MDVCINVPRLALDRPFTYVARPDQPVGMGSHVSVPFHGRTVRGWVLGEALEPPAGRLLPLRRVLSPVRFFDPSMLRLLRWVSERYVSPLCTVIERSHPPRVAGLDRSIVDGGGASASQPPSRQGTTSASPVHGDRRMEPYVERYGGPRLLEGGAVTWVRPLPEDEAAVCVAAVQACVGTAHAAVVIVPQADPLPYTARAVLEAFGDRAVAFLGGEQRDRYRTWLEMNAGRYEVVVGTRPAVFAPVQNIGLVWISREVHPGHREDRAPYYHVREVAAARAGLDGAACILASLCPSVETSVSVSGGRVRAARPPRAEERRAAPLVETVPPEAEDRSARVGALLRKARSAALLVTRRGVGVARACRVCGAAARCPMCRGPLTVETSGPRCMVCRAPGRCAACGGVRFGIERGGAGHVAEWASRMAGRRVEVVSADGTQPVPGPDRLVVGTAAAVDDAGPVRLDLVAILDPDRALARPGIGAEEQAVATWMEAAAWAGPRSAGGRVVIQTRDPGHPAVQALVRWDPDRFLHHQAARLAEAGFAPGRPVFRVVGASGVEGMLEVAGARVVLSTAGDEGTVCLVTVGTEALARFGEEVRRLAASGAVSRVEAEPQL